MTPSPFSPKASATNAGETSPLPAGRLFHHRLGPHPPLLSWGTNALLSARPHAPHDLEAPPPPLGWGASAPPSARPHPPHVWEASPPPSAGCPQADAPSPAPQPPGASSSVSEQVLLPEILAV
ncbi:hypothetical protein PAHAL_7G048700 [Panicum hallii]|uniref:Uncharacterized protein n=1 Tax=Panicum hallii TaxID=206008 RepID=A0A2T8IAZ9_9POAL|nr:hypothetical protein PAHAL_7G048700 [Panicum hallii]